MSIVYNVFLFLDGMIYGLIDSIFDVFNFLAKVNLFSNENYMKIVRNVYMILGLIMLFALSYSLLKAVINPDEFAKGEQSFPKMIKNVIISLAIIAVLPTVFNFAFNLQNTILNQHTIPRLILGEEFDGNNNSSPGRLLSYNMFSAFLHVNEEYCTKDNENETVFDTSDAKTCAEDIKTNKSNAKWYKPWRLLNKSETFYDIDTSIKDGEIAMVNYNNFGEAVAEGKLSYLMLISTICGLYILWVLTNFCFDMAVRVIKLVFFQIIAPIPVVCRVIPGGKLKDVFSTWTKKTIGTFVDVFIRVGILYLGIFIIQLVIENWPNLDVSKLSYTQGLIAKALVLMGTVIFIRQAPKLISDMFHLDTGDMKLGLMDKLAAGGGLMAAAATGGLGLGAVRNFAKSRRDGKGILSSAGSALTGGLAAGIGAGYGARKAKNFNDLKSATSKGISNQMDARKKVQNYIAKRKNEPGGVSGALWDDFTGWLTGKGVEDLDKIITASGDVNKANDAFRAAAKKQWDKHSTDGAIVYDAGTDMANNFFKGAGNERMFELYNTYRDSEGHMMGASLIKDNIEQRKAEMRNRDLNYYINQERQASGISLNVPNREDFYSTMTDSSGKRIFDENSYNQALTKYNDKMAEIERTAQAKYNSDIADLSYLDSMYNQLEKKSITELGRAALEGRSVGTVTEADLFETKEYGETAQRVIRDSGLEQFDPAKNERVEVKNGDYAAFIDDMAAAASRQAGHAAREKQNYLEKKKNS
ncbi:MAG: hypothetical protein KIC76_04230 [Firmicutes bacterium]|nr:hypothetical protein [Bacillota bacterium]